MKKRASKSVRQSAEKGRIAMVPIEKIRMGDGTQIRERIDPATVADYAESLADGASFPPPVVFCDGADYWPGDGHHRIEAHARNGKRSIRCEVRQGDRRAAVLYAVGANAAHGLRRSNADKRRAVLTLLNDEQWRELSDRKIAEMCGVSHTFVSNERAAQSGNGCQVAASVLTLPPAPLTAAPAINPPLKWHGGKQPLARRIIALMPPHRTYVEPFAGGLAVLLAKSPEGISEVANDIDGRLTNFWTVLKTPALFRRFLRQAQATPFCEQIWETVEADLDVSERVPRAWAFFVRCRQSLAGRMTSFAPLSVNRTRRGMNEQVAAWLNAIEGLPAVHERLKRVAILNRDGLDVIRQHDSPETLFYLDPPYFPATRTTPEVYAHEMTADQHRQLLKLIQRCQGKVILSGYPNELYARELAGWQCFEADRPNSAAGGDFKRRMTEAVWCNFTPAIAQRRSA